MTSPNKELLSFSLSFLNLLIPLLAQATSNTTPGRQVVAVPPHSLQLLLLSLMPVLCASLASVMLDLVLPAAARVLDVVAAAHAVVFLVLAAIAVLPTTRLLCALGVYISVVVAVVALVPWFRGVGGAARADDDGSSGESSRDGPAAEAISSHHENIGQGGS